MKRSLEEILNTPIEFKENMKVFSLITFEFGYLGIMANYKQYPFRLYDDNGDEFGETYTENGYFHRCSKKRHLLTEQEACELFPSLKPKVYEYQVVFKMKGDDTGKHMISSGFYLSLDDFLSRNLLPNVIDIELYKPSKRERKS